MLFREFVVVVFEVGVLVGCSSRKCIGEFVSGVCRKCIFVVPFPSAADESFSSAIGVISM